MTTERARSFWGWGFLDRFPSDETRRQLAEQIEALVGFEGLEPRPVPKVEAIALAKPRIEAPSALASILSAEPLERITHTYGKSYRDLVRGFTGDFSSAPDLVARPKTESEIERVLEWASSAWVAVIPFGGGTSVVGGVEAIIGGAYRGAVSLDVTALDRVLEVDDVSRHARIQAGATGPGLEAQLAARGFTLRHYPQSFEHSTLGGWIATRAGGHYATLYTHIDDFVASIRMLSPAGLYQSSTLPASGAGPSPDRMVLGSEGILGVITEATMRLQERPQFRARAGVHFTHFKDGVRAARALAQSGLYPTNCRLLDEREAALFGVTGDGSSVLLLGFESADHPLEAWIDRAIAICASFAGRCPKGRHASSDARDRTSSEDAAWRAAFLEAPYLQSVLVSFGVIADTFETACTWSRFDALHEAVIHDVRAAMKRVAGKGRITCRFTHVYPDGPAPYYTFLAPARPGGELEQWAEIKAAASEALAAHGATITHHHAVGRTHRPWYDRERPSLFAEALRRAKSAFDPSAILNPGVLIDG